MASISAETPHSMLATGKQPASVTSSASRNKEVTARILKKRESDRRCQRIKRERTKSKIAALEERVRTFSTQDSTGQVQLLVKQLQDVERERDNLAKKIKTIEGVIKEGEADASDQGKPDRRKYKSSNSGCATPSVADSPDQDHTNISIRSPNEEGESETYCPAPSDDVPDMDCVTPYNTHVLDTSSSSIGGLSDPYVTQDPTLIAINEPPVTSLDKQGCECRSEQSGLGTRHRFNIWRFLNETLSSRFHWPSYSHLLADEYHEDTPVRAMVEGWEALDACGGVHPSWAIIKSMDQTVFGRCGQKERLAVVVIIQLLLMSHTKKQPVPELPDFYQKRPSQDMADSYAIHFFPWPGMRERFVFNQHKYCSNAFWDALVRAYCISWPYEFRDAYTHNVETGLYSVSPLFRQYINNINCWTVNTDLFQKWPELSSDMPASNRIPSAVSNWIRKPRRPKAPPRQTTAISDQGQVNQVKATSNRDQAGPLYVQLQEYTPAVSYHQPFLYNTNERMPPTLSRTGHIPHNHHQQQQQQQQQSGSMDYYTSLAYTNNISPTY